MDSDGWRKWFEEAWSIRENQIYPQLFGPYPPQICVLTFEIFKDVFKQDTVDPRWLHYGVFEVPPTPERQSWVYVSSGLSNAWEDDSPNPDGPSGLGMEFLLMTPGQAPWAVYRLLHVVAFQILVACGKYPGRDLLDFYDRLPLRSSVSPESSALTWFMVGPPDGFQDRFQLPSGWVDLLAVVGITDDEAAHARAHGGDTLLEVLRKNASYPLTDPTRSSVIEAA